MAADNGRPLPKFGEWDVNNPASAEGFTVIFNKARNEKKTNSANQGNDHPYNRQGQGPHQRPPPKKRWFCCR